MSATAAHLTNEQYEERKKFLENLKSLVKEEQEQLYRILKRSGAEMSENTNGVFFDICSIQTPIFERLSEFMNLCLKNREEFRIREDEQHRLLQSIADDNDTA